MDENYAVSEIIGVILLMGIIVAAFSIFAAIYLPKVIPNAIPHVKLTIACSSDGTEGVDIEYPCNLGGFSCLDVPFDYEMCKKDCQTRVYSKRLSDSSENQDGNIRRCIDNCLKPICSDPRICNIVYICHNGGDSLVLQNMDIILNNGAIPKEKWSVQLPGDNYTTPPTGGLFDVGSTIRFTTEDRSIPVERIMIIYRSPSGEEYTMVSKQFGTDVK
jgi:hypothetical protein